MSGEVARSGLLFHRSRKTNPSGGSSREHPMSMFVLVDKVLFHMVTDDVEQLAKNAEAGETASWWGSEQRDSHIDLTQVSSVSKSPSPIKDHGHELHGFVLTSGQEHEAYWALSAEDRDAWVEILQIKIGHPEKRSPELQKQHGICEAMLAEIKQKNNVVLETGSGPKSTLGFVVSGNKVVSLVPGSPASSTSKDTETGEMVHIDIGDTLLEVDGTVVTLDNCTDLLRGDDCIGSISTIKFRKAPGAAGGDGKTPSSPKTQSPTSPMPVMRRSSTTRLVMPKSPGTEQGHVHEVALIRAPIARIKPMAEFVLSLSSKASTGAKVTPKDLEQWRSQIQEAISIEALYKAADEQRILELSSLFMCEMAMAAAREATLIKTLTELQSNLDARDDHWKTQVNELNAELDRLKIALAESLRLSEEKDIRIQELEMELNQARQRVRDFENVNQESSENALRLQRLQEENERLKKALAEAELKLEEKMEELDASRLELSRKADELADSQSDLADSRRKVVSLESRNQFLAGQVEDTTVRLCNSVSEVAHTSAPSPSKTNSESSRLIVLVEIVDQLLREVGAMLDHTLTGKLEEDITHLSMSQKVQLLQRIIDDSEKRRSGTAMAGEQLATRLFEIESIMRELLQSTYCQNVDGLSSVGLAQEVASNFKAMDTNLIELDRLITLTLRAMLNEEDLKLKTTLEKTEMLVDEYCRLSHLQRASPKPKNPYSDPLQAFLRAGSLFIMSGLGTPVSEKMNETDAFDNEKFGLLSPRIQSGCSTPRGGLIV